MEYFGASVLIIFAYFLGSIPFGLVLAKYKGYGDIREQGSGNIGATNAYRVGGKQLAIAVLLCDACKGAFAVAVANLLKVDELVVGLVALAAVVGHCFPIWLKFKGGKGVATGFGVILPISSLLGLIGFTTWYSVFHVSKKSSLSALSAIGSIFIFSWFLTPQIIAACISLICIIILYRHRSNIERLINDEEKSL